MSALQYRDPTHLPQPRHQPRCRARVAADHVSGRTARAEPLKSGW